MDEKFNVPKRARRRAYLAKVRRKARLKAERRYAQYLIENRNRSDHYQPSMLELYIQYMKGEGHWIDGGCSNVECGICQYWEPSARDMRENERMRDSLREEL